MKKLTPLAVTGVLVGGLIAINILTAFIPLRMDITEEGLYTLSTGSKTIIGKLEDRVEMRLYFSESMAIPVGFKTYAKKVLDLLGEYEAKSGGKITLVVHDPKPDTEEEEWAIRYGINQAKLPTGEGMFFGLAVLMAEREEVVPFFDPRREKFLEYDISEALTRVMKKDKPGLAVVSSIPMGGQGFPGGHSPQEWAFVSELRKSYRVEVISPDTLVEIPQDISLVILLHPKLMPPRLSYAMDQFVVRGGRLIAMLDPNSREDPANQMQPQQQMNAPTGSNMPELLKAWGVNFNPGDIVGDQKLALQVNTQGFGIVKYPLWVSLSQENLNSELAMTSELEELVLIEAGSFHKREDTKYTFTPLITSTDKAGTIGSMVARYTAPNKMMQTIKPDGMKRNFSAMVSGTFETAYPGGAPPAEPQQPNSPPPRNPTMPHLAKGEKEGMVLLLGDSDFISDRYAVRVVNFFGNRMVQPLNDNLNFLLNAVEFMVGGEDLIHIRSRGKFSRPFDKLEELQEQAAARFQEEEERLSQRLEQVKKNMRELEEQKKGSSRMLLSSEQITELNKFRVEESRTKRQLREVRKLLREDIESLGNVLLALNLLAVPLVVAILGFVVIYRRNYRNRGAK
ncbi:MAG: Gldg family protein [Deltaproteobacteria bacterium]|nr:Gldg family protein [Deltaproteobacteria bacterium]